MTAREICYSYRSAKHKAQQIQILAELNGVDSLEIIKVLVHGGEELPDSTVNKLFKRLAPITPHLYMTQCLNEDKPEERAAGMAAGLTLLKRCDFVIVGVKYGISEGMSAEIAAADAAGIEVVNADKLRYKLEHDRRAWLDEYAKLHACEFCRGSRLHTCTGYRCIKPYKEAYEYAEKHFTSG